MLNRFKTEPYPFVEPDLNKWPLVKLAADRENFINQLINHAFDKITKISTAEEAIAKAIYLENIRIKEDPWKVDPADEKKFWKGIKKELVSLSEAGNKDDTYDDLLKKIIRRYAEEIAGNFKIKTYWFARRFLTMMFTRLMNAAKAKNIFRIGSMRYRLQNRIQAVGEIDHLRTLTQKGTVVVVPTHFSNLDSILIGLTLDFVGVPAFSYGAGLNLFNVGILAYFMNRLGAYRLDRRKKNSIYLETLKGYSQLTIYRGTHSLFFPGGTRSRSGMIEKSLKMGLLGTVIEAQKTHLEKGSDEKIFVVPMVLNYHNVLEGNSLIKQYLKREGKEWYLPNDEFRSNWKILKFLWQFFSSSSEIKVQFGKPMDVMGNFVDEEGRSYNAKNETIEIKDYFTSGGAIKSDHQRDKIYTKILSEKIIDRLHRENIVLESHIVSFVAFNLFKQQHPNLDLYGLLRLSFSDFSIQYDDLKQAISNTLHQIRIFEKEGKLQVSESITDDIDKIISKGVRSVGVYHVKKALILKDDELTSQSLELLLFYHNRLVGYGLDKFVNAESRTLAEAI